MASVGPGTVYTRQTTPKRPRPPGAVEPKDKQITAWRSYTNACLSIGMDPAPITAAKIVTCFYWYCGDQRLSANSPMGNVLRPEGDARDTLDLEWTIEPKDMGLFHGQGTSSDSSCPPYCSTARRGPQQC